MVAATAATAAGCSAADCIRAHKAGRSTKADLLTASANVRLTVVSERRPDSAGRVEVAAAAAEKVAATAEAEAVRNCGNCLSL